MVKKFRKEISCKEDYFPLVSELALISTDFQYAFRSHHGYYFWKPLTRGEIISHLALNSASPHLASDGHNLEIVTPQEIRYHANNVYFSWYPEKGTNVLMVWGKLWALNEALLARDWTVTKRGG